MRQVNHRRGSAVVRRHLHIPALVAALASIGAPTQLGGQSKAHRLEIAAGPFLFPYGAPVGALGRVGLPISIGSPLVLTPGVDLAYTVKRGCDASGSPEDLRCGELPDVEIAGSISALVGLEDRSRARPHIDVGGALVHRFASDLPEDDRRDLLVPVVEAGLRPPAEWGAWSVSIRWRLLDRSPLEGKRHEFAVLLGLVFGKAK